MRRKAATVTLFALLLVLAACGGDDDDDGAPDQPEDPAPTEATEDDADPTPTPAETAAEEDDSNPTPAETEEDEPTATPEPEATPAPTDTPEPAEPEVSTVVDGVAMPSSITFAPDGRMFFIEVWDGRIRVAQDGQLLEEPFATLDIVQVQGFTEWGLIGLTLHPDFAENGYVYAFYTQADESGNPLRQRIVRFTDDGNVGTNMEVIVDDLPYGPSCCHNGGRMTFGPDGHLYVSLGDNEQEQQAQDPENIAGSILRYTADGGVPEDNPFGPENPVYAWGLRNPYGLTFHPETQELWATENGPNGFDEVNLIQPGQNYGWPVVMGMAGNPDYVDPIWATGEGGALGITGIEIPSGEAIPDLGGDVLFCAWNTGTALAVGLAEDNTVAGERELPVECNLDVTEGPDGALYFASSEAITRYGPPEGS